MNIGIKVHLPRVKWDKDSVISYIEACRKDKGLPVFKTKFAGIEFEINGKPAVMAVCWAGNDLVGSQIFTDVPKDVVGFLEEGVGDWRRLVKKYAPEKLPELEKYGIFIKGGRLPRILKRI